MTRALMFMGTGSDVGKSLIVAGLCRAFADRGLRVAPFKPQNMSNNAAVTADGGEIGRAQALQARAARRPAQIAMNPVLLKPEHDSGAQLIVHGARVGSFSARDYWARRGALLPEVLAGFDTLKKSADLVLVEGAGSASEINLRSGDIANFGFARAANVPVVLIGDIDRGGIIAALLGTFSVIDPADRALIRASLVNKFRGDVALFAEGLAAIARMSGRPCLGPVPFLAEAAKLPAEDALGLIGSTPRSGGFLVAVPRLPRIANFDDFDPLRLEPGVTVDFVAPGRPLPQASDLVVIPGSKAVRADLETLRATGWDIDILAHARAGKPVLGLCGGYQMLGRTLADPLGLEGAPGTSAGLGLLDIDTVLEARKTLRHETGVHLASGGALSGYHMHMGVSSGPDRTRPFAMIGGEGEGAVSRDDRIAGTYLHGLFASAPVRRHYLGAIATPDLDYDAEVEATLDALAGHLAAHLDVEALLGLAERVS